MGYQLLSLLPGFEALLAEGLARSNHLKILGLCYHMLLQPGLKLPEPGLYRHYQQQSRQHQHQDQPASGNQGHTRAGDDGGDQKKYVDALFTVVYPYFDADDVGKAPLNSTANPALHTYLKACDRGQITPHRRIHQHALTLSHSHLRGHDWYLFPSSAPASSTSTHDTAGWIANMKKEQGAGGETKAGDRTGTGTGTEGETGEQPSARRRRPFSVRSWKKQARRRMNEVFQQWLATEESRGSTAQEGAFRDYVRQSLP